MTPILDKNSVAESKNINNQILTNCLGKLGVRADVSGRNDLLAAGKKISGSAYKLVLRSHGEFQGLSLHHGTMLISLQMNNMKKYLNPNKEKLKSKAIDSVIARVTNLADINSSISHESFCRQLESEFVDFWCPSQINRKAVDDQSATKDPYVKKTFAELQNWEWVYGHSPEFSNHLEKRFDWGICDFNFQVKEGHIVQGKLYSDCLFVEYIDGINLILAQCKIPYNRVGLKELLRRIRLLSL